MFCSGYEPSSNLALDLVKYDGRQGAHVIEGPCILFFLKLPCDERKKGDQDFSPAVIGESNGGPPLLNIIEGTLRNRIKVYNAKPIFNYFLKYELRSDS
jgi:hypothetical protein